MDIQVAKFRQVLELLKPAVPRKPSLPVLTNILLQDGKAVATDLDTMVIVQVPEADIHCLVPYADVVKMIQYIQGLQYLHIETANGMLTLTWPDGSSTFSTKDVQEFPAVPEFVPVVEAPLDIDTLIPAMYEVLAFAATETDRPVLNGVTLVMGEPVAVAAGDGFRMAYRAMGLSFPQDSISILPRNSVNVLKLLWEKTPRTPPPSDSLIPIIMARKQATVAFNADKGLRFIFGDSTTAIVKLVQGDPPAWLKLMPKKDPVLQATVMAAQMELAVRRVMRLALEGSKIVRLVFNDATVAVSAKHEDQEVESTVKTYGMQGAPNRVGLNASYLLNYLKGREGMVTISWVEEGTPVLFKHQNSPTVLIMPMKVDWDGTVAKAAAEAEQEAEAETEPGEEVEPEAETEPVAEVEPVAETEPVAEVEPVAEAKAAAKSPTRRGKKK